MKHLFWVALVAITVGCAGTEETTAVPDFTGGARDVSVQPSGAIVPLRTEGPVMVRGKNTFVLGPFGGKVRDASGFMPAHGHGTKPPVLETLADGSQRVELVLYMSGRWEVSFDLERGGSADTLRLDVQVP